ncbi:CPBP family intramembrane glutamic endopeptidase [Herbiconiux sp. A18JL235]|uniref:CPBP family intramembrane glutamic endopeptidase n=1 Tax=Herbiconiux sp. A18JL235 TaxID=3152363 RepID=A0AB39BBV2_9MICO
MTEIHHHTAGYPTTGWRGFWNRGGWWKAVIVAAAYVALYNLAGLALVPLVGGFVTKDNFLSDPLAAFLAIGLQPLIGSVLLVIFALSLGWLPRPLFGRQPVPRRWWFWIGPILVLVPIVFHFLGIDYGRYGLPVVAAVLFAGVFVGFSEDFLSRGLVVVLLRRHGYREWAVAVLSSLVFAALHLSNLIAGQGLDTVGPLVIYTFAFGMCMYATLRAGGNLIWPILLHILTDPTTILASGGIDNGTNAALNTPNIIASGATVAYVVWAIVLLIVTRGDAQGRAEAEEAPREFPRRHRAAKAAETA